MNPLMLLLIFLLLGFCSVSMAKVENKKKTSIVHMEHPIAKHPRVISVFSNKGKKLHTTHSWSFLGLVPSSSIWKKARSDGRQIKADWKSEGKASLFKHTAAQRSRDQDDKGPANAISSCNGPCNSENDCSGQLVCINGKCNDHPDVGTHICSGSNPEPPPSSGEDAPVEMSSLKDIYAFSASSRAENEGTHSRSRRLMIQGSQRLPPPGPHN